MKHKLASAFLAVVLAISCAAIVTAQQTSPSDASQSDTQSTPNSGTTEQAPATSEGGMQSDSGMPNTASPLPLIALLGVASLGAGVVTDRLSKRTRAR